ncbi:S49 family peptidase [Chitinimonas koreensis]|uniref:S49 family peptidase n=1 Tax=Chitinimonas koreensis TaxID=356302 RepID=UPI0004100B8D|nr:S49 family peptidase [Chitinimonas koreensis]QNM95616.1 S49 family peptidase [Chitinimonas koreensis]
MNEQQNPNWERQTLEKMLVTALKEQRKGRNWSIFFRFVGFAWLFLVLAIIVTWRHGSGGAEAGRRTAGPHSALVDLRGVIAAGEQANADDINGALREAFKDKNTRGVILRINSPGGSPVQAGQIADEIRRQRKLYPNTPLYVVVDDICASGGYYVAAAADKIFVDKASLVGSIGVLMDGFGFTGAMDKLGVERRLLTAGENKGFLDPFSPQNPQQVEYAKQMLEEVHQQFIKVVRDGRGKRLKETPDMFSGLVWSGEKSVELGLSDAYGSADSVARDVIKAADIVDFTPRESWADRFAKSIGASAGAKLGSYFEFKLK